MSPRGLRLRVSLALVALAIGAVEIVQFIWFKQSASGEIEGSLHSLSSEVGQVFSREFQRFAALASGLRDLASDSKADRSEIRSGLERLRDAYGPSGKTLALATSFGIASLADPKAATIIGADGAWKAAACPFPIPLSPDAATALGEGKVLCYLDLEKPSRQILVVRAGSWGLAFAEIDVEAFIAARIRPAVASELPGISVAYSDSNVAAQAWDRKGLEDQRAAKPRFDFNPVRILFGIGTSERRSFRLQVPSRLDEYLSHTLVPFDAKASPEGGHGSQEGGNRAASNWHRPGTATVSMSGDSATAAMELRLSLNWLLMTVLIAGIGVAFAQALIEKYKFREVGEREREFVASVTHEFRTPVTAIKTAAYNMRKGLVERGRMEAYEEMIYSQATRLGSMVEEMLLFARLEGRKEVAPAAVEIRTSDFLARLRVPLDEIARSLGARLSWDFGALPESFVGDAEALQVIIGNVVANAIYHAYPEGAKGEVRAIGRARLRGALQFVVEDDGRGIAKAEAHSVFEPFYRDEESRARHESGTGLGLFIARRKAELMGGSLSLESPYKRIDGARRNGCRFILELPSKEARVGR
jgi:Signal transduction histidine kinase